MDLEPNCLFLLSMQSPVKSYIMLKESLAKAEHYCSYQERCHSEVKNKLFEIGTHPGDFDEVFLHLMKGNFLNEERFARSFARGKFKIKGWGKLKISNELKLRGINTKLISFAFEEIDEDAYLATLNKALQAKRRLTKGKNSFDLATKLKRFALQKGFEMELVGRWLKENEIL